MGAHKERLGQRQEGGEHQHRETKEKVRRFTCAVPTEEGGGIQPPQQSSDSEAASPQTEVLHCKGAAEVHRPDLAGLLVE